MSTRLAPTVACIGTFVLLMHLTAAGVVSSHRTVLPLDGLSRIRRVIGEIAPANAAALPGARGPSADPGAVVTP
ncbi:hypothetical protein [Streptomyces geranii]|uniref:hypothetical protein n=1 Tax=Streptomyces geranii TaxID=2058923 RepID=UPI0013003F1D|nr:hypothetical protein [Streptomyces geranii]